jgi:hypothetical protein
MMQRIVAPTAAFLGAAAAATAAATIALLLTLPTVRAVPPSDGNDVLPFLYAVVTMITDAAWALLKYL